MIPVSLSLKDFLSYGPAVQTLSFADLGLAVLAGPNGAGKSALLDALTWAVWGRARARNEDLVRRGAEAALVEFTFQLGGQTWRATRSYARRGGRHEAALFRVSPGGDALEAQGVKAVADAVRELIRLPYDSFIASVYFKQGEAAYFTRHLNPRQRKDLLFSLLGLDRFVTLGERAAQAARADREDLARLEGDAAHLQAEAAKLGPARAEEEAAAREQTRAEDETNDARRARDAARDDEAAFVGRLAHIAEQANRRACLDEDWERTGGRLARAEAVCAALDATLEAGDEIRRARREWEEARRAVAVLEGREAEAAELERRRAEVTAAADGRRRLAENALAAAEERRRNAENAVASLRTLAAAIPALVGEARELEAAEEERRELKTREQAHRAEEANLAAARAELAGQEAALRAALASLNNAAAKWRDLDDRLAFARAALVQKSARQEERQREAAILEEAEQRAAALAAEHAAARREADLAAGDIAALRARLEDVGKAETACPTCGRPFDDAAREEAQTHIAAEIEAATGRRRALKERTESVARELARARPRPGALADARRLITAGEKELGRMIAEVAELDRGYLERGALLKETAAVERELAALPGSAAARAAVEADAALRACAFDPAALAECEGRVERLLPARYKLAEAARASNALAASNLAAAVENAEGIRQSLEGGFWEGDEYATLRSIEEKQQALAFDAPKLTAARQRASAREAAASRYRELERAEETLPAAREAAAAAATDLARLGRERDELARLSGEAPAIEKKLAAARARLDAAAARERQAAANARAAASRWAIARAARSRLEEETSKLAGVENAVGDARRRFAVDDWLAAALGPNGIPALMTERALAELEDETNAILARLSGGRMAARLETQREKKTGGLAETLDVTILDAGRPRPYESFSGGETFRVDFALRLGLSRLLARRASVPLRFLVVDEGFGTQDEEGLGALVEVLGEVRRDFDRIPRHIAPSGTAGPLSGAGGSGEGRAGLFDL